MDSKHILPTNSNNAIFTASSLEASINLSSVLKRRYRSHQNGSLTFDLKRFKILNC